MPFRRRRQRDEPATPAPDPTDTGADDLEAAAARADTELLATTVAGHFDGARVDGDEVRIDPLGLSIGCEVSSLTDTGSGVAASLYLTLSGAALGSYPVFASINGYGSDPLAAIVEGACLWCCSFGPAIRAAVSGVAEPDADEFEVVVDGRAYRAVVGNLDRLMRSDDADDVDSRAVLRTVREGLGGTPLLTPVVLADGALPALTPDAISTVGLLVMEQPGSRTVEVKISGRDWPASHDAFDAHTPPAFPGTMALLRELAFLVPVAPPPPLTRAVVERTLAAFDAASALPARAHGWPGWRAHGGRLGVPLPADELAGIEAGTGPLPAPFRRFLAEVAGPGAGPGYGLLPPALDGGVVPLADAGCGVRWVLRLDDPHRGEVWCDASGSDETYRRVYGTFDEWYAGWLDAAVRGGPWLHWDSLCCATASTVLQLLETGAAPSGARIGTGGISLVRTGGRVDACHGCTELVSRFGLDDTVFRDAPGGSTGTITGAV